MNRLLVLAAPLLILAISGRGGSAAPANEPAAGNENAWQASLSAETGGRYSEARKHIVVYARAGGDRFLATIRTAWLHLQASNYGEAEKYYTAAMRLKPGALSPRLGLLNVATAGTDHAAIIRAAERVIEVESTNYTALMAAAWSRYLTGQHSGARQCYCKVLALYPEDATAMSGAAWSSWHLGRKSEAKRGFRRLLALNPNYPHAERGIELCSGWDSTPTDETHDPGNIRPQPARRVDDQRPRAGLRPPHR